MKTAKYYCMRFYVTYRCNSRCYYCNVWQEERFFKTKELTLKEAESLIRQCYEAGIRYIDFTGGEPALNENLAEMIRYAAGLGIKTEVTVNGLSACRERLLEVAESADKFNISLDTLKPDVYKRVRGVDGPDRTLETLEEVRKVRAPKIMTVISKENIGELDGLIRFAQEKKTEIYLNPVFSYFGEASESWENYLDLLLARIYEPYTVVMLHFMEFIKNADLREGPPCSANDKTLTFAPDGGLILPCYHAMEETIPWTGNLAKMLESETFRRYAAMEEAGRCMGCRVIPYFGISCDGERKSGIDCSSSRIDILESCYYEIVQIAKEHLDIKNIAIPIIGAGEYGFPFETAVKIAIASVGNALAEWKNADNELFEMAGLSHIYFYIFDTDKKRCRQNFKCASEVLDRYRQIFKNDKKAVFQNSFEAHVRYLCEIKRYDNKRGYFAAAKGCRMLLMLLRFLFMPIMFIKDWRGGDDWERRRQSVERLALGKMIFPVAAWGLWLYVCDTVTYLLTLILMSDIQRPSANIIRSMIMLLVNYMEVSLGMAFLYFVRYKDVIGQARKAVRFGILGEWVKDVEISGLVDYVFVYEDAAVKFFFISIVFGYFSSHMKQRRFRS